MTKDESKFIYGIGIIVMLVHHLFCWESPNDILLRFAWFCRICCPLFAFVSGYGMCCVRKKNNPKNSMGVDYALAIRQLLKTFGKLWLVFAIFVPLGYVMGKAPSLSLKNFCLTLVGLRFDYNSEWWYIRAYAMMLLLFPVLAFVTTNVSTFVNDNIVEKYAHGKQIVWGIVAGVLILGGLFRNAPVFGWFIQMLDVGDFVYLIVFAEGFFIAYFDLFGKGKRWILQAKWKELAGLAFSLVVTAGCCFMRIYRAYSPAYCKYDAFIIVPIIVSLLLFFHYCRKILGWCQILGKYSTYMWLTHTFFCAYYFKSFFDMISNPLAKYCILLLVSLITSWLLTKFERMIVFVWNKNMIKK